MVNCVNAFARDNDISWRIKRRKSYENVQIGDEISDELRIESSELAA